MIKGSIHQSPRIILNVYATYNRALSYMKIIDRTSKRNKQVHNYTQSFQHSSPKNWESSTKSNWEKYGIPEQCY